VQFGTLLRPITSSKILITRADQFGISFCCTDYVIYECLYKKTNHSEYDLFLQNNLKELRQQNKFQYFSPSIEDLQQEKLLSERYKLGRGELSSGDTRGELSTLAFALNKKLAFLSDDRKACRIAKEILQTDHVQTTPHLFSWLVYNCIISDSEKNDVINQHRDNGGNIAEHLETAYLIACESRCNDQNRT
jgi:hypothetical protein